jgi:hypothetical protein
MLGPGSVVDVQLGLSTAAEVMIVAVSDPQIRDRRRLWSGLSRHE